MGKRARRKNHCRLVLVEWEDSVQPQPGWVAVGDWEPSGAVRIASAGWLWQQSKRLTVLAPNVGGLDGRAQGQMSGMLQIPTSCVLRITALDEGDPLEVRR